MIMIMIMMMMMMMMMMMIILRRGEHRVQFEACVWSLTRRR